MSEAGNPIVRMFLHHLGNLSIDSETHHTSSKKVVLSAAQIMQYNMAGRKVHIKTGSEDLAAPLASRGLSILYSRLRQVETDIANLGISQSQRQGIVKKRVYG